MSGSDRLLPNPMSALLISNRVDHTHCPMDGKLFFGGSGDASRRIQAFGVRNLTHASAPVGPQLKRIGGQRIQSLVNVITFAALNRE